MRYITGLAYPTDPTRICYLLSLQWFNASVSVSFVVCAFFQSKFCLVNDDSYYQYCPSTGAAVAFAAIFGLSTFIHFIQAIVYRKGFCWVIVMAGIWETAGFVTRIYSSLNVFSPAFGVPSELLILLAPLWINAFDYMVLGRLVHYYLPGHKIGGIRPQRLAVCFVLLDIVYVIFQISVNAAHTCHSSFVVQGAGGSMANPSSSANIQKIGIHVYMAGIGIQEFFVLMFIILTIQAYRKLNRISERDRPTNWRIIFSVLLASLTLITVSPSDHIFFFGLMIY